MDEVTTIDQVIERRFYRAELRLKRDGDTIKIIGYGSVFNSLSDDMGGWQEIVEPGAFSEVLEDDIRSLFNHDFNMILGRTAAGTLKVKEDDIGLRYEVTPPETSYAKDLITSIERGDVDQSSIGFRVKEARWDTQRIIPLRRIIKYERLYDVGPVTIPAFPTTSVAVRDYLSNLLSQAAERDEVARLGQAAGDPARRLDLLKRRLRLVSSQ